MFRNFGKVFSFSLHNQVGTKSYKIFTIVFALLLLVMPSIVMMLAASHHGEEEEKPIESCGAEMVYIVSDFDATPNLMLFNEVTEDNYKNIKYKNADSIDAALASAAKEDAAFVLHFYPEEDYIRTDIILPKVQDGKEAMDAKTAENYYDFIDRNATLFSLLLTGLNQSEISGLMPGNNYKTYTESGFAEGISIDESKNGSEELIRDSVMEVFQIVLPYVTIMMLYFLIVAYGNATAQSMVMEKESKLMDTMLISLQPEAMVAGKFMAIVCAGLIQVFGWGASIVAGMIAGVKITEALNPGYESPIAVFLSFMGELGLFRPLNVLIGIGFMTIGFVMYLSLATIAGAISANRQEVAAHSSLYTLPVVGAFMLVMMGGGLTAGGAPVWMEYVPFTAALLMPSQMALGTADAMTGLVSLLIMLALTIGLIIVAGRIYKAMSLYKGNKVKIADVIRLVTAKEG
ncbi:MAG: ABC transporter permease [Lachnospiraceae bacterium]|nr:ABC transporter permease [Lachnospiraceae bacterium]